MKRIVLSLITAVWIVGVASAASPPSTPLPFASIQSSIGMTPYCLSSAPASAVGGFMPIATSGVSANVLTVTDGLYVYKATVNSSTGAVTCFVKQ